jgi:hypothetical protein
MISANYAMTIPLKEVQETSCQGFGGVPQILNSPKTGGQRGFETVEKEVQETSCRGFGGLS